MKAPKIDWRKHDAAIVEVIRSLTEHYLGTSPNRATPGKFRPVIAWLEEQTEPVEAKAKPIRIALAAANTPQLTPQWIIDLNRWNKRLAAYRSITEQAISMNPDDRNAADFTKRVTAPLLIGWYPDPEQIGQKPPDVVTPLTIAFIEKIKTGHRKETWNALWADLGKRTRVTGIGALGVAVIAGLTALVISKAGED